MNASTKAAPGPAGEVRGPTWIGPADLLLVVGGLLWLPYGIFEFLSPWGVDAVYDDGRGYEVVTDRLVFTVYTAPGAAALLLTALGALGLVGRLRAGGRSRRFTVLVLWLAVAASVVSLIGVATAWDPMATGGRIGGSLLLGIGTVAAAAASARDPLAPVALLGGLGALGLFLLPLWPLVYAVDVVPPIGAVCVLGTFGLGWVVLGTLMSRRGGGAARDRPIGPV